MALTSIKTKNVDGWNREVTERGDATYVGRVLEIFSRCERIMSDVWDDVSYAVVLEDDGVATKTIPLGTSEFGWNFECKVDADLKVIADWKARVKVAADAEAAALAKAYDERMRVEAEELAKAAALAPVRGSRVRVVRGRKVPKGTEGVVTWSAEGDYGLRLGIKDDAGKVHYTASSNAERITSKSEDESWMEYNVRTYRARPIQGEGVRMTSGQHAGTVGVCFYLAEERVGVTLTSRKEQGRYVDVIWTSVSEVERTSERVILPDAFVAPKPVEAQIEIPF